MLVKFAVSNFLSFKERVEFSLEKVSKSQQHKESIIDGLLRSACIYGANNSGKTNLLRAVRFLSRVVNRGSVSAEYKPYYTFIPNTDNNSKFEIWFRKNENIYNYILECGIDGVSLEELYVGKKLIFKRTKDDVEKLTNYGMLEGIPFYVNRRFKKDSLYLTKLFEDNIFEESDLKHKSYFEDISEWFSNLFCIQLNASVTGTGFCLYLEKEVEFKEYLQNLLQQIDSNISSIDWQKLPDDVAKSQFELISSRIRDDKPTGNFFIRRGYDFIIFTKTENSIEAKKLYTYHNNERFEVNWESDGTKKIIELALAFYFLNVADVTVFIDELDASLHPIFVRKIINSFMKSKTKSQLIFTSHNIPLLTHEIWRVDQIWFIEKVADGSSRLYSLQQFAPRFDKNISKDYLMGKYGAIPVGDRNWKW